MREAKPKEISIFSELRNRMTPQGSKRRLQIHEKLVIYTIVILCLVASITAILIWKSSTTPDLVWTNLDALPEVVTPPAAVSSSAPVDSDAYIAPYICNATADFAIDQIERILRTDDSFRHVRRDENQVQAVAITPLLGFQDDVIFQARTDPDRIEIYSASRVGIGDMGTNRKRLEEMRELLRRLYVVK